jgi:hypothetical protein
MSRKLSMKWGQEEKISVNKLRFVILRPWSPQAPPKVCKLDRGNPMSKALRAEKTGFPLSSMTRRERMTTFICVTV